MTKGKRPGRAAAAFAVTAGVLLALSAVSYGVVAVNGWYFASASVSVSTAGAVTVPAPSLVTTLLYLLPFLCFFLAAMLAAAAGRLRWRGPAVWALALLAVGAGAYRLLTPETFALSYHTLYRALPPLRELALAGFPPFRLLYMTAAVLLAVFWLICPKRAE